MKRKSTKKTKKTIRPFWSHPILFLNVDFTNLVLAIVLRSNRKVFANVLANITEQCRGQSSLEEMWWLICRRFGGSLFVSWVAH